MVFAKVFSVFSVLSTDMGIDLGTSNTRVCVRGRGIVVDEPSVVAVKKGTSEVLVGGVGERAKRMLGRTPLSIEVVRPLEGGVVSDFDMTGALLGHFIRQAGERRRFLSPRIVMNVPTGINAVEKRAIFNAADRAGARRVFLVEEPRAAGLGAGLPIHEAKACMVVDIGGGTTDVSILSLGDVVLSATTKIAGDAMDEAIVKYIQRNYNVLIGANTAEEIKVAIGSVGLDEHGRDWRGESVEVKGRDLIAGVPRAVTILGEEVREALREPVGQIVDLVRTTLERTGPELSGDLLERGMMLCGGGVLLRGLPEVLREETGLAVKVAPDPAQTVVRGTGVFLEYLDRFAPILESAEDDL